VRSLREAKTGTTPVLATDHTVPERAEHTVPERAEHTVPERAEHTVPERAEHTVPERTEHTVMLTPRRLSGDRAPRTAA
jgi:hypothetical protein